MARLITNSTQLVEVVEDLHTDFIDSKPYLNADEIKQKIIGMIKNISKSYYTKGKEYVEKHGTHSSLYVETCIWGHIYNLNKSKALRVLNKYKKDMSDIIDGMLFDGLQHPIHNINFQENTKEMMSFLEKTFTKLKEEKMIGLFKIQKVFF